MRRQLIDFKYMFDQLEKIGLLKLFDRNVHRNIVQLNSIIQPLAKLRAGIL